VLLPPERCNKGHTPVREERYDSGLQVKKWLSPHPRTSGTGGENAWLTPRCSVGNVLGWSAAFAMRNTAASTRCLSRPIAFPSRSAEKRENDDRGSVSECMFLFASALLTNDQNPALNPALPKIDSLHGSLIPGMFPGRCFSPVSARPIPTVSSSDRSVPQARDWPFREPAAPGCPALGGHRLTTSVNRPWRP